MRRHAATLLIFGVASLLAPPLLADQSGLQPVVNAHDQVLELDWPGLRVGTGEYAEGPTGVTVFYFPKRVLAAVDVLGGSPSSVNSDYLELGYDYPELDAVVFAGGSWYGLEAVTAVSSALKDDGLRDGNAFGTVASPEPNIAFAVGSIIFDFGPRRLNEIYPDKALAQAAFRGAREGFFPQGAHGAGRMAKFGGFFGCNAYSGQGGAQRQSGEIKVAAFAVVNAYGLVTDRTGHPAACYPEKNWPENLRTADLLEDFPAVRNPDWKGRTASPGGRNSNTTISLVVVNQKLTPAELKRLAVQVHTSMSRAIQPFATLYDGDALYAVSTAEVEEQLMTGPDLGMLASEVMWDAILAAVPEQPGFPAEARFSPAAGSLDAYQGEFSFSGMASLSVRASGSKLFARASGKVDIFLIGKDEDTELLAISGTDFTVPGRYPLLLHFEGPDQLVLNPGHWQQTGTRTDGGHQP